MLLETLVLPLEVSHSAFNAGLKVAAAGVGALVGAMGLAIKSTFDWADSLDQVQDVMGVTNTEAAALNFIARKSKTDIGALTQANTILAKGLVKVDGTLDTTGKALKSWGVNIFDVNGKMKNQKSLMDDIAKKYKMLGTQTEKVNFLTEIYGKSGANLVDFFDTLANDGSIDEVSKKVEALGLAIDPNRYEQFNRNLEELKMIGLGLAVSFTEKIMPSLEKFLGWISDVAQSQEWADFKEGFSDFTHSMVSALSQGDWEAAWILIKEKLSQLDQLIADQFDSMDWSGAGASFGLALDKIMKNGAGQIDVPKSLQSLLDGINQFFLSATGADQFGGWKNYFFVWGEQIKAGWGATLTNWNIEARNFLITTANSFLSNFDGTWRDVFRVSWAIMGAQSGYLLQKLTESWVVGIANWGASVYNKAIEWVNKILSAINSVSGLNLSIPTAGAPAGGATGGRGNTPRGGGRASGGPVIKGQLYDVLDFYGPEGFRAPVSGRVDPVSSAPPFDIDELAEKIGEAVGLSVGQMFQKYA